MSAMTGETPAVSPADPPADRPAAPRQTLAMRLAARERSRAERSERLARLRPGEAPPSPDAAEARIATALDAALDGLGSALGQVLARLDGQADVLHAHIAREDLVAGRLAELAALAGTPAAFTETLGLTLAEFLARIEALAESRARIRAPSPASASTPVPAGPVRAGQAG